MRFDSDPPKAAYNVATHGIAFERIADFDWDTAVIRAALGPADSEVRLKATGMLESRVYVAIFMIRRTSLRLISFRPASQKETRFYAAQRD